MMIKCRCFSVLFLLLITISGLSQTDSLPTLEWADSYGPSSYFEIWDGTLDSDDNLISVGFFGGTMDLEQGAGVYPLTAEGSGNAFIQKTDSAGDFVWAKGIIDSCTIISPLTVATNSDRSILLGGYYYGCDSVDVDPDPINSFYLEADSATGRMFLIKLDENGVFNWGLEHKGASCKSAIFDKSGNIYLVGIFEGELDRNPDPNVQDLITSNGRDFFIEKLDSSGNQIWIKVIQGPGLTDANCITLNNKGEVVVAGHIEQSVNFNPGGAAMIAIPDAIFNGYVFTLDTSGNSKDVFLIQGTSRSRIVDLEIDEHNNLYMVGWYKGTDIDFDPGPAVWPLVANASGGYFVMKTDETGFPDWVRPYDHPLNSIDFRAVNLSLDEKNTTYVSGWLANNEVYLEPNNPNGPVLHNNGSLAMFQAAHDSSGTVVWAKDYQGNSVAVSRKIIAKGNNLYTFGAFTNSIELGTTGPFTLNEPGGNCFLMKQKLPNTCSLQDTILEFVACDSLVAPNGLTYYTDAGYTDSLLTTEGQCDSLVHYEIHIDSPPITAITLDTVINQLSVPQGAESYQWISCDGDTILPGANQNTYQVQIPGNYAVVIANGECTDTSVCIASMGIGLAENFASKTISIYPNPTDGKIYLEAEPKEINGVKILDYSGRLLQTWPARTAVIDLSDLSQGTYILMVNYKGVVSPVRVLKTD